MKITIEVIETIINYEHVASKDETRPYLCSIALRMLDNDLLEITACNGYTAIRSSHKVVSDNNLEINTYYLMPIENIKKLKMFINDNKMHKSFEMYLEKDHMVFKINKDAIDGVSSRLINREYPNIDPLFLIITKDNTPMESIIFNPDLMYDLRKSVYGVKKRGCNPKFKFQFHNEASTVVKVTYNNIDHACLIMPMKDV